MQSVSFKGAFCIPTPVLLQKQRDKLMKKYDKYHMKFKTICHRNDVNETYIYVPDSYDDKIEKMLNKMDIPHYYFNPFQSLDINEIHSRIVMDELDKTIGLSQVEIDVKKLDKILQETHYYVGYNGIGGSKEKYMGFKDFLHTRNSIEPPLLHLERQKDRTVSTIIQDGRHRFAVLRDIGLKTIPVRMNEDSFELAKEIGIIYT